MPGPPRPRVWLALALSALAGAGCGTERQRGADLESVGATGGLAKLEFPEAGIELRAPRQWRIDRKQPPGVVTATAGTGVLSVFAYDRDEPTPRTAVQLTDARKRLTLDVRRRAKDFDLRRVRTTHVDRAPAIDVEGDQTIARARLRTRSVHIFRRGSEYVIELLAPRREFASAEREVLVPALRSAELTGRVKDRPSGGR